MRRSLTSLILSATLLLGGCNTRPVEPVPTAAPATAAVTQASLVTAEAESMAGEAHRALIDLAVARDPILAAPGALQRVEAARAALERLEQTAGPGAAPDLAPQRTLLEHAAELLSATIALDEKRVAAAAEHLRPDPSGELAGRRAQEAVLTALEALRKRYVEPWPRQEVLVVTMEGVDARGTPLMLPPLKQAGIRAVFFVTEAQAATHPDLVRTIAEEGHLLGIWLQAATQATLGRDLESAARAVRQAAGVSPRLVRIAGDAPWERYHLHVLEAGGFVVMQTTHIIRPLRPDTGGLNAAIAGLQPGKGPYLLTLDLPAGTWQAPGALESMVRTLRQRRIAPGVLSNQAQGIWPAAAGLLR